MASRVASTLARANRPPPEPREGRWTLRKSSNPHPNLGEGCGPLSILARAYWPSPLVNEGRRPSSLSHQRWGSNHERRAYVQLFFFLKFSFSFSFLSLFFMEKKERKKGKSKNLKTKMPLTSNEVKLFFDINTATLDFYLAQSLLRALI